MSRSLPSYGGDGGRKSCVVNVHSVPRVGNSSGRASAAPQCGQSLPAGKVTSAHPAHLAAMGF